MRAQEGREFFTRERLRERYEYDPQSGFVLNLRTKQIVTAENNYGYLWVHPRETAILVHRMAFRIVTGEWPVGMVDHIDGNRKNNSFANLRVSDHARNAQNQHKAMSTNKLGLLGVRLDPRRVARPYRAAIQVGSKKISLGAFASAEEAYAAYLKAKRVHHPCASLAWEGGAAASRVRACIPGEGA